MIQLKDCIIESIIKNMAETYIALFSSYEILTHRQILMSNLIVNLSEQAEGIYL